MTVPNVTKAEDLDDIWSEEWDSGDIIKAIKRINRNEFVRWFLKYAPCHGKFLEAGCGVGQYVFYMNEIGFDIEGLDISSKAIEKCKNFAEEQGINQNSFKIGDVRDLDYADNTFSYYLSFGVVEHFKEGPKEAIDEAFRILKPGGVAFFGTPNKYSLNNNRTFIGWIFILPDYPKRWVRKIMELLGLRKSGYRTGWVENYWTLKELKSHIRNSGFLVVDAVNVDLKRTFSVNWRPQRKALNKILRKIRPFFYPFLDKFEDSKLGRFGTNNIVFAVKPGKEMSCFFCGDSFDFKDLNFGDYTIPVCHECLNNTSKDITSHYKARQKPSFKRRIYLQKEKPSVKERVCRNCSKDYEEDKIYGDFFIDDNLCIDCLRVKEINLDARNNLLYYKNVDY